jgi:hypothetical protein
MRQNDLPGLVILVAVEGSKPVTVRVQMAHLSVLPHKVYTHRRRNG